MPGQDPNLDAAAAAADRFAGAAAAESYNASTSSAYDSAQRAADRFAAAAQESFPTTREPENNAALFACLAGAGLIVLFAFMRK